MSVATELQRIIDAKADLKTAIEAKGVTVSSDTLIDDYPALVTAIPTGEKGYTEWPSALPTHTQLITAATEWANNLGLFNYISYIIFKGNQIDDPYIYNSSSQGINTYFYFSDTQTTDHTTIPGGGDYLTLSNHTWSDANIYHWVFIAGGYISSFKNWNFFYSNNNRNNANSSYFNTDENGNVFAPSDTTISFQTIVRQLSGYSSFGNTLHGSAGWTSPIKLPQINVGTISVGLNEDISTIRELYIKSGTTITETPSFSNPYCLIKITADSWPLGADSFKNCKALREIDATLTLSETSLANAFNGIYSLKSLTLPDTSSVTNMSYMFYGARLSDISILDDLDTSGATDMSYMFSSTWMKAYPTLDYSSATTLRGIFIQARHTKGSCTINAPNCTDLSSAFSYGNDAESITINAPKNTLLNNTFQYCDHATTISITPASTAKVTDFSACFSGCSKITSLNAMNTSNANSNKYNSMFNNCTSLTTLGTEQVTDKDGNTVNSWIFNYSVDLGYSPLNLASIKHVMENLKSGVSSQTFKLSKTSKTYLEAEPATDGTSANLWEQLSAEAASKGWTVSVNNSY